MKALIPIPSDSLGCRYGTVLLDPMKLSQWYGFNAPCQVAKTSLAVEPGDEWQIILEEDHRRITLLSSYEVCLKEPTVLDFIERLGHPLCVAPWQKLGFATSGDLLKYVTYIFDQTDA